MDPEIFTEMQTFQVIFIIYIAYRKLRKLNLTKDNLLDSHSIFTSLFTFLVCEYCQTFFVDECSVHGAPLFIRDTVAELGLPNRATCTLPSGFRIGLSSIPRAGFGVWNEKETLTPGIHFGPYEGTRTEEEAAANSGYSWLV